MGWNKWFYILFSSNKIEFNQFVDSFTSDSKAPILFEVFTTPEDEKKLMKRLSLLIIKDYQVRLL